MPALKLVLLIVPAAACHAQEPVPTTPQTTLAAEHATFSKDEIQHMIDRGRSGEALKVLGPLAAQTPPPHGVKHLQGEADYSLNRFAEAADAFRGAIAQDPSDLESVQLLGLSLFRLGRPADAIPLLTKAQEWNATTRTDPSYVLALCYLDTRQFDEARRAFATQYGFQPDSAPAYLLSARMLLRREFLPVSQEYARKAAELDPQLPLVHLLLGELALAGNHLEEAIKEFEREQSRDPLQAEPYARLGDAYLRAGDLERASKSLQRAILLEPQATGPYILLGKTLLKQQSPANAVMYLEHAGQMDPNNYMTHYLLGQAYRSLGRDEDAAREVQLTQKLQKATEPNLHDVR